MALSIKEKYNMLDMSKLPKDLKEGFADVKSGTENFDSDLVDIFTDEFNELYGIVENKFPDAIKKKQKVMTKKSTVTRPKARKTPAKKTAKKKTPVARKNQSASVGGSGDDIESCKKVLKDANYSVTKKLSKGKRVEQKVRRQDRTIIKDKVGDTITTIDKDLTASDDSKKENAGKIKLIGEIKEMFTRIMQSLDHIVNEGSEADLKKFRDFLSKIDPGK